MSHASRAGRAADAAPQRSTIGAPPFIAGLLAAVLLAGCGSAAPAVTPASESPTTVPPTSVLAPPTAPPVPPAPTSPVAAAPKPRSTATAGTPERVTLPWPAASPAEVRALQASVDGGSEPWLLDPTEVALSYVTAARGWTGAQAQARPGGKRVDVRKGPHRLLLTLDQPSRAGSGGIWVVTAENPSG